MFNFTQLQERCRPIRRDRQSAWYFTSNHHGRNWSHGHIPTARSQVKTCPQSVTRYIYPTHFHFRVVIVDSLEGDCQVETIHSRLAVVSTSRANTGRVSSRVAKVSVSIFDTIVEQGSNRGQLECLCGCGRRSFIYKYLVYSKNAPSL